MPPASLVEDDPDAQSSAAATSAAKAVPNSASAGAAPEGTDAGPMGIAAQSADGPCRHADAADRREVGAHVSQAPTSEGSRTTAALDATSPGSRSPEDAAPIADATSATRTGPNLPAEADAPGSAVSVTFLPTATTPEILAFLERYNLMVVDGPSPQGAYRVRLSPIQLPRALIAQFVKTMRDETKVVKEVTE